MKTLLLHLSDIHIRDKGDKVLRLGPLISRAAATFRPSIHERAIIFVTGDVANTGVESEYAAATDFLLTVRENLARDLTLDRSSVSIILAPGNHDCDFSSPQTLRDIVLSKIATASELRDKQIAEVLAAPQSQFRALVQKLRDEGSSPEPISENNFYTTYAIGSAPSQLVVNCYNTAICSRRHELPASLRFPVEEVSSGEPDRFTFVVSLFHHPYYWMHPDSVRQFQQAIERTSDLVLTGHEHVGSDRDVFSSTGESLTYVAAPVLQDRNDPRRSGFNVFTVDSQLRKYTSAEFAYEQSGGGRYVPPLLPDNAEPAWSDLPLNKLRTRGSFPFSEQHVRQAKPGRGG